VPVQVSVHVEERGGRLVHRQWIADGPEDPRPALAEAVVEACAGARKIVAYHASFERECIKRLREAVPRLAKELDARHLKEATCAAALLPTLRVRVHVAPGGFATKLHAGAGYTRSQYRSSSLAKRGTASRSRLMHSRSKLAW